MTEEEFENEILYNYYTVASYEEEILSVDIMMYYKLKLSTEVVHRICVEKVQNAILPSTRKKLKIIEEKIKNIRDMMYSPEYEFNFCTKTTVKDFDLLLDLVGVDEDYYRNAVLRLYYYSEFKHLSVAEILNICPERENFPQWLEENSREGLELWQELHPNAAVKEPEVEEHHIK
ncbi:MAG: hypothetical protein IJ093_03440 [Bacilli bacterium]|nr:hypothetical protein [Bacilli bacterium]